MKWLLVLAVVDISWVLIAMAMTVLVMGLLVMSIEFAMPLPVKAIRLVTLVVFFVVMAILILAGMFECRYFGQNARMQLLLLRSAARWL